MHQVIDHAVAYVNGRVHTNGLENFWSLLKRGVKELMLALSRSTCFVILMSRLSATITARTKPILTALLKS